MTSRLVKLATIAALLTAPLSIAATAPADAATVNWMRSCSTVKSHPMSVTCTESPLVAGHTLDYRDAAGTLHSLHTTKAVLAFINGHGGGQCKTTAQLGCWIRDDVTKQRFVVFSNRLHVAFSRLH